MSRNSYNLEPNMKRTKKSVKAQISYEFLIVNIFREQQLAGVYGEEGYNPPILLSFHQTLWLFPSYSLFH